MNDQVQCCSYDMCTEARPVPLFTFVKWVVQMQVETKNFLFLNVFGKTYFLVGTLFLRHVKKSYKN